MFDTVCNLGDEVESSAHPNTVSLHVSDKHFQIELDKRSSLPVFKANNRFLVTRRMRSYSVVDICKMLSRTE